MGAAHGGWRALPCATTRSSTSCGPTIDGRGSADTTKPRSRWLGAILLLREVGFSLNQIRQILRPASASGSAAWRDVAARKLKDLDDRIEEAEAARSALQHALAHHDDDVLDCPRFWAAVTNRLQGASLQVSHPH